MNSRGIQARSQDPPAKRVPSVNSVRSAKLATHEIAQLPRLQTPKPQPTNGDGGINPEAFLARAGLGKKIVNLKKDEVAYAQGDRKSTRLNSSHLGISYAVFCLKKKQTNQEVDTTAARTNAQRSLERKFKRT